MAQRLGAGPAFYSAVTEARWERGGEYFDLAVVRSAAISAGIEPETILQAMNDPEIVARGTDCLADAYEDDIFGVPYHRYRRHRFWGIDRVDAFVKSLGWAPNDAADDMGQIPEEVQAFIGGCDTDTAGGCG